MRKAQPLRVTTAALALLTFVFGTIATGQSTSERDVAKSFIGTWRLVSITLNGQINPDRGPNPTGLIIYDGNGYMAVQIMPDRERPKYVGSKPTGEEAQAALLGYTAYFGTYTVDAVAGTVTHHRQGNVIPGVAREVVRRYEFAPGDRVILTPVENPASRLTWERVKK